MSNPSDDSSDSVTLAIDEKTKKRFSNLAVVGNFLYEISNETAGDTDYFLAKTSLQEYQKAVNALELSLEDKTGINNLINYLDKKIEKRKRQASGEFSQD